MREVDAVDAKTQLSERLAAVEAGERVTVHDALYLERAGRRWPRAWRWHRRIEGFHRRLHRESAPVLPLRASIMIRGPYRE